ncbi:MAG: FHA domain-containing protein [Gammaproteobacteria bacterium]|nr:MAG: FHA domain-containing protein [Gammaproteobacteria bacterium]
MSEHDQPETPLVEREEDLAATDEVNVEYLQELLRSPVRLTLEFREQQFEIHPAQRVFVVGRGEDADLRVDVSTVSRNHARFVFRNGKFVLIDSSRNGTFVRPEGGDEVCLMEQEEFPLSGTGVIGLGELTTSGSDLLIYYNCTSID